METFGKVFRWLVLMLVIFSGLPAYADEIVMKSGERFSTSKVWEENGKIIFDMEGLTVNVEKDEVETIIRDTDPQTQPDHATRKPNDVPQDIEGIEDGLASDNETIWVMNDVALPITKTAPTYPSPTTKNNSNYNHLDLGTGFNGIEWQMTSEQLPGLEIIETDPAFGGIDQYWLPEHPLRWGWAQLDGWVFGFWEDRLYSIMMWANGPTAYQELRKQAFKSFGPGKRNVDNEERYVWDEPSTQRMIEYDRRLGVGLFVMRSSALDAKIKERYPD